MMYCEVPCLNRSSYFFKSFPYKWALTRIRTEFKTYFSKFSVTLKKHLNNEFEVPIRCRKVTDDGEKLLDVLEMEFKCLQYEERIIEIVQNYKNHYRIRNKSYIKDLLDVVVDDIIEEVESYVSLKHKEVLKDRRSLNNKLCSEKITSGPAIMNFTEVKIDSELMNHLLKGLKCVPDLKCDKQKLEKIQLFFLS